MELFFIISPPKDIMSDVSELKSDVQFLVGHELEDRYSKAHISLFKFDEKAHFEYILDLVQSKASHVKPFNVFLKNLNVFHHGSNRTIYLDIVNKYPIRDIFEKLVEKTVRFTPHITIARNMKFKDFRKTWQHLEDFSYSRHFLCDRITVLERPRTRWRHLRDIKFESSANPK